MFLCEIHKSTILLYLLFCFYKSKEIRRLSFYLTSDTLFETVSKKFIEAICILKKKNYLCNPFNGALAERLGTGLQNLIERFDSARHLARASMETSVEALFFEDFFYRNLPEFSSVRGQKCAFVCFKDGKKELYLQSHC